MGIGRARWVALLVGLAAAAVVATLGASEGDADPLYRYVGLVTPWILCPVLRHLFKDLVIWRGLWGCVCVLRLVRGADCVCNGISEGVWR